eukprot:4211897-Prymnesium_polylepis.1
MALGRPSHRRRLSRRALRCRPAGDRRPLCCALRRHPLHRSLLGSLPLRAQPLARAALRGRNRIGPRPIRRRPRGSRLLRHRLLLLGGHSRRH